jgi:dienelactone hydrolase|tara:strand:+ start:2812 stop:3114 length:303 start_codon:yes stop_codon:yes gene_type:complete
MRVGMSFRLIHLFPLVAITTLCAWGEQVTKVVQHQLGDLMFESTIVYSDLGGELKPGILMIPNWMGPTEGSLDKAKKIAGDSYVVMMADVYSVGGSVNHL